MKKIILLSDSHHSLDERIFPHLQECDEIWHAGDIGDLKVTDKLKKYAPLRAVWGNIDSQKVRKEFRETTYFKCEELKVMMTHIGGYPGRYEKGIKVIGVNYKDNTEKTINWLEDLGNPYKDILIDKNGKIAIDWGVYGIPETFIISSNGIVKYRHVGPITSEIYRKINLIIKQNE